MKKVDEIIDFAKSSKLVFFYFAVITILMVYQHSMGWAWDFSVYSLNAQYLLHEQVYMEWKRPPLLPFILGLIQFFVSMRLAEYIAVLLISALFFYSVYRLSEKYEVKFNALYILVASPGVVFFSVLQGTELLFLSFLILALSNLDRPIAGIWLGLAFLTHYTGGIFLILLFFQKDFKKIVKSGLLFGLTILPWLLFSYYALGHPIAGIADSYALDVAERSLTTPFNPLDIFYITALAIPFALYHLKDGKLERMDYIMIFVFGLIVVRQLLTDMKITRYMFDLALPAGYLAARGLENIDRENLLTAIAVVYVILSVFAVAQFTGNHVVNPHTFEEASEEIGYCQSVSDSWPYLSYAGTPTGPLEEQFKSEEDYLDEGVKIVEFEPGGYSAEGSNCVEEPFHSTYIERLDEVHDVRICDYAPVSYCRIEDRVVKLLN